jgi:hypothetical protein
MTSVWQAGWVALMAALWTAVIYFKANILARRPFVRLLVLNIVMTACLCIFAATDRKHGVPPAITYKIAVLEPVILGIVLAGPRNGPATAAPNWSSQRAVGPLARVCRQQHSDMSEDRVWWAL